MDRSFDAPFDMTRILAALPHRFPFVLVDRVHAIEPFVRIRGHKNVSAGELWLQGHFPDRPIMPGVLLIEAIAQLGGILAHVSEPLGDDAKQGALTMLLGVDKAKFRRPVVPGDRVDLDVQVLARRGPTWRFFGEASVEGALAASAEVLASTVSGSPQEP